MMLMHLGRLGWGILFVVVGILLLLENMGVLSFGEFVRLYWPLLLVLLGIMVLRRPYATLKAGGGRAELFRASSSATAGGQEATERLNSSSMLGDVTVRVASKSFRGGFVSTVFGDMHLDLTEGGLADGEQLLKISGVFGDIDVRLPADMVIAVSAHALAGRVQVGEQAKEGFSCTLVHEAPGYGTASRKLHIAVSHVFGDITIQR